MKQFKMRYSFVFVFMAVMALAFGTVTAQDLDNKGTDFILTFLPQFTSGSDLELHLTAETATDVTIEWPMNSPTFSTTETVNPGAITIVTIPVGADAWTAGSVQDNAVHAFADDEFVAYMVNRAPFTSDAALGLPTDIFNVDYIVITNDGTDLGSFDGGEFVVVASQDNTQVTITPSNDLQGGFSAGVPFNITLNRGEGFFGRSVANGGDAADLTGTEIVSDKPVGMTSGNVCANVPANVAYCDHIFEVAQPLQSWGNQVFVSNLPNRPNGVIYRIIAGADNTTITQDGAVLGTINKGEFIQTDYLPGNHVFEGDNAIFVVQFMTGSQSPGATLGDPAMGNMAPSEQYLFDYTFSTVGNEQFVSHFLNVVAHNDDITAGSILLDGVAIAAGDFDPIPGTDFSAAVLSLSEGTHTTSSNLFPHGITVEGINDDDSYLYPGGASFVPINPVNDLIPPVCDVTSDDGCVVEVTVTDDHEDASGIFLIRLDRDSENLVLTVDDFEQGATMVSYSVTVEDNTMPGSGSVTTIDGEGNLCVVEIDLDCGGSAEFADLSGTVFADGVGLYGIFVNLYDAADNLIGTETTDGDGNYLFDELASGDYTVSVQVPLGFMPVSDVMVPFTMAGSDVEVNFELASAQDGVCKQNYWWWKQQFSLLENEEKRMYAMFTMEEIEMFSEGIFEHFFSRPDDYAVQIEDVTFADFASPRPLSYEELRDFFLADFVHEWDYKFYRHLRSILLGIANGCRSQLAEVSEDGATLSQALNYLIMLFNEGDERDKYWAVVNIQRIDVSRLIDAGVIPPETPNVMFKNEDGSILADNFVLEQNYPNPFNPSTSINFYLPQAGNVSVEIFNIAGQRVRTIADGTYSAGQHQVEWNGISEDGSAVASGIYFYRLRTDDFTATKKMMLMK